MYIGEDISLWISLSIWSTTEGMNRGLDTSVIGDNNRCRNRDRRIGGGGLSIMVVYTHVENALGLNLRYL